MRVKKIVICLLTISLAFTCGCWDQIELNQRSFIFSIAIDVNKDGSDEKSNMTFDQPIKDQSSKIKVMYFMPMPTKVAGEGGGGEEDKYTIEESTGSSIPEAIRNLSLSSGRTPYFGQIKVILLGENLLKNPKEFKSVLDFIEREPDLGRTMKVAAIKGDIGNLRNIEVQFDKVFAFYIENLFDTIDKNTFMAPTSITEFISSIRENNGNVVVPCIAVKDGKAEVQSLALIKDYKFVGNLEPQYIRTYAYLTEKIQTGRKLIEYKDDIISYRINSIKKKIWVDDMGGKLKFTIKLRGEGDVEQYSFGQEATEDVIRDISSKLEDDTRNEIDRNIKHFQRDYGYDFIDFKDYTKKHYYSIYKKYKDNWDEVFRNSEVDYDITMYIRRIGPEQ